jgi:type IV secretory pathway VirB9-like protein
MSAEGGDQAADVWIFPDGSVRAIPVEVLRYQLAAALKEEEEIHSIFLLDREPWVVDSTYAWSLEEFELD